ncbi:hypothetical protein ANN_19138 [Periplaneta americana]|uniref:Uncharacterized protein n=1 Tax=Periplaneta americana TaxID=6978 RepID=A0ABQ8S9U7_PERAM|nr:hypothetical protein ANN_19095 [Periplaneta americana]KAJ4430550.1 hypothetical protein ANN_19138 [Periplaneta americana]
MGPKTCNKSEEIEETVKRVVKEALQDTGMLQVLANLIKETVTNSVVTELQKTTKFNNEVISELKSVLVKRDEKIEALETKVDELEQYQRRQCLRIFGVEEQEAEDTDKMVMEVVKRIGVDVNVMDIDRSHRIGRRDVGNDRPRPISVKFVSYRKRSEVLKNKRLLKNNWCNDSRRPGQNPA